MDDDAQGECRVRVRVSVRVSVKVMVMIEVINTHMPPATNTNHPNLVPYSWRFHQISPARAWSEM